MTKRKKNKEIKKFEWLNFDTAILLLLILAIFVIIKTSVSPKSDLEKEAQIVLYTLTDGREEVSVVEANELIEEKIRNLDEMNYNEIKSMLGVKGDFCIFFEDTTGNLVKIDGIDTGIGSDKIYVNGRPCR